MIGNIWNYFTSKHTQRKIEVLKNDLAIEKSEKDARRQYEFEARKKLYQEYEPLLFQLVEASDDALHRIKSIARTAKYGNLDLDNDSWLAVFKYYMKSTLYKLFVPLAIYKIMQKKLTLVDLTVDENLELKYKLAKQLYISYTDDFEFARMFKEIKYDPNNKNWKEKREIDPITFWRQGLPMGLLDKVLDLLIFKDMDGKERIISYGEFEKKLITENNEDENNDINLSKDIFYNFHPSKRPILWRILITQAQIFKVLISLQKNYKQEVLEDLGELLIYNNKDKESINDFNWKNTEAIDSEAEEPFLAANEYLRKKLW